MRILIFSLIFCCFFNFTQQNDAPTLLSDQFTIANYRNYWLIKLVCSQGPFACAYQFGTLPYGWSYRNSRLKIPKLNDDRTNEFSAYVIIVDNRGRKSEKVLNILMDQGRIFIIVQEPEAKEQKQKVSQSKYNDLVIKNQNQLSWLQKNGIVAFLPSISYLDKIIVSGNILRITRIFQNIASDKSNCHEKNEYLKDVIERVNQHISYGEQLIQKEKRSSQNAKLQIQKLKIQKQRLIKELKLAKSLNKDDLEKEVRQLEDEKATVYTKHFSYSIVAMKYFQKLKAIIGGNKISQEELQKASHQIEKGKEELKDIEEEIGKLIEKKFKIQWKIRQNRKKIEDKEKVKEVDPVQVKRIEEKYKEFSDLAQKHKVELKEIQTSLKRAKGRFEATQSNADEIREKLSKIDEDIQKAKEIKNDNRIIKKINTLVNILKRNNPKLEQSKQKCEKKIQEKQKSFKEKEKVLIYPTTRRRVINDLHDSSIPPLSQLEQKHPILLKINIFSTAWIIKYGPPTTSSFLCNEKKKPAYGYGIITAINKSIMRVRDSSGNINALYLGVCSELMGIKTDFVPEVGDFIDWEGDLVVNGIVNIHKSRIYRK